MKNLYNFVLAVLFMFIVSSFKVNASENEAILSKSQITLDNKYAERFCGAKADHFFEGLDNEKTLKYSYFKYIGMQNKEILSKNNYKNLIHQIREKCIINNEEEKELNEFYLRKKN